MRAAFHAGLPVPKIQLSDNGQFLVIERFDLAADGTYLGFEDFCVLSALNSDQKYDASYEEVATRIVQFVSPQSSLTALKQFFTSVTLSCAVFNGDAHLKNFGVLYTDSQSKVVFAPTYDIVTTAVYQPFDTMALTLQGKKLFPRYRQLLKFGIKNCKIPSREVAAIIEKVSDAVAKTRTELQQHLSTCPEFRNVGTSMLNCWEAGVARINEKE